MAPRIVCTYTEKTTHARAHQQQESSLNGEVGGEQGGMRTQRTWRMCLAIVNTDCFCFLVPNLPEKERRALLRALYIRYTIGNVCHVSFVSRNGTVCHVSFVSRSGTVCHVSLRSIRGIRGMRLVMNSGPYHHIGIIGHTRANRPW